MRERITRERLDLLMETLARDAPRQGHYCVYFVGGGTAVYCGWRESSIDVDMCADDEIVFRHIQKTKELLNMNIEFVRPEDFVPPLAGSDGRHVFIRTTGPISFYHYDPYAQLFSKIVRGFERDISDAHELIESGMVDAATARALITEIPDSAYARYPALSRDSVSLALQSALP